MKPDTAQHALLSLMETISEETWRATWYLGLEYLLWIDVLICKAGGKPEHTSLIDADTLGDLAKEAGGWIYWPRETDGYPAECGPTFIPMAEWLELYARRAQKDAVQQ